MSRASLKKMSLGVVVLLAVAGCDRAVEPLGECVRGVWLNEPQRITCTEVLGQHDPVLDPQSDCHPVGVDTLEADGSSTLIMLRWSPSARLVKSEGSFTDGWWKVEARTLTWLTAGRGATGEADVFPNVQCDAETLRRTEFALPYTRATPEMEAAIRKAMAERNKVFSY